MENKPKEPAHIAAKRKLKAGFAAVSANAFVLFLLCSIAAASSILSTFLVAAAIAFLVLPFLFAFTHLMVGYTEKGLMPDNRMTLHYFGLYFSPQYYGVYRVLINMLKAMGFFMGALWLSGIVYGIAAYASDPQFAELLIGAGEAYLNNDYETLLSIMNTTEIVHYTNICNLIATGVGVCAFAYFIGNYGMNPFLRYYSSALDHGLAGAFYNRYYALSKKKFHRLYWKRGYGVYIVLPLSYAIPATVVSFFPELGPFATAIALGCFGLALSIYTPYLIALATEFWDRHTKNILRAQSQLADEMYERAASLPGIGEEELETLRQNYEKAKAHLDDPQATDEDDE